MLKKAGWMVAALAFAGFSGLATAATMSPDVYGFRIEKINKDDDAYRYGNL